MKIGIDIRLYRQTGVGTYIRNLIHELSQLKDHKEHQFILFGLSDVENLKLSSDNFSLHIVNAHWHSFAEQTTFLDEINRHQIDLMHFTYFSFPILYKRPFVITIHDLIPLHFKSGQASAQNPFVYEIKHLAYRLLLWRAVNNSKAIIVPSNSVKDDILTTYTQVAEKKIHITYEGVNQELLDTPPNMEHKEKYDEPFFMYVGNFYPHKNVENLLHAYSKAKTSHRLILIGPKDYFSRRIMLFAKELNIADKVTFLFDIQLSDLSFFYRHAEALVHPSRAEGFGLTLVEAAHFGCPIIASDIPTAREILGNSYLAFDPNNVDSLVDALEKGSSSALQKPKLSRIFSFADMAEKTLDIYQNASS